MNVFVNRRSIVFAFLSLASFAPHLPAQEPVPEKVDADVELLLKLGVQPPTREQPAQVVLIGTIINRSDDVIQCDSFPGERLELFAVQSVVDTGSKNEPLPPHWPLQLYGPEPPVATKLDVPPKSSQVIFRLDVAEILGQRDQQNNDDLTWGWGWPAKSRPPSSPMFPCPWDRRTAEKAEVGEIALWIETSHGPGMLKSNRVSLAVDNSKTPHEVPGSP